MVTEGYPSSVLLVYVEHGIPPDQRIFSRDRLCLDGAKPAANQSSPIAVKQPDPLQALIINSSRSLIGIKGSVAVFQINPVVRHRRIGIKTSACFKAAGDLYRSRITLESNPGPWLKCDLGLMDYSPLD